MMNMFRKKISPIFSRNSIIDDEVIEFRRDTERAQIETLLKKQIRNFVYDEQLITFKFDEISNYLEQFISPSDSLINDDGLSFKLHSHP